MYQSIKMPNQAIMLNAQKRVDQLVKPQKSLGDLEAFAIRLAGIYECPNPSIEKKAVIVFCADHKVCDEDIASAPPIVTLLQSINIAKGVSGLSAMAKALNVDVFTVDIGINCESTPDSLIDKKIKKGADNIAIGYAMTLEEVHRAIQVGIDMVQDLKSQGYNLLATGEMGIGNTTPATALLSAITGNPAESLTGQGANYPVHKLEHKSDVINRALTSKTFDSTNPIELLSALGGLEIAGMTGAMIGAAESKLPMVVDGYIATVSAILAVMINPTVKDYLFPSHASFEKSAKLASDFLGLKPFLHLEMRLGEGSGAILAFPVLEAACAMINYMATFEEAGIGVV